MFAQVDKNGHFIYADNKEQDMNSVKMVLSNGTDQLEKTVQMTDSMLDEIGATHSIKLLDRDMAVTNLQLDADPKWTMYITFDLPDKVDPIPLKEFSTLMGEGWELRD